MSNKPLEKVSIIPQDDAPIANLPQTNSSSIAKMDPLVAMIERAARDPSIDLDRLDRLMQMQERSQSRAVEAAFNEAMSSVQSELTPIARDSNNPQTRSKYASYHAIDKAIRPVYVRHGFRVSFDTADDGPADHVRVLAIVTKGGHSERYHYDSPVTTTGIQGKAMMTLTHAKASAVTYAKRYLAGMIFNLSTGEDTDGNAPNTGELISDADVADLRMSLKYAVDFETEERHLCAYLKIETLFDMPANILQRAKDAIAKKAAATKAATLKAAEDRI